METRSAIIPPVNVNSNGTSLLDDSCFANNAFADGTIRLDVFNVGVNVGCS